MLSTHKKTQVKLLPRSSISKRPKQKEEANYSTRWNKPCKVKSTPTHQIIQWGTLTVQSPNRNQFIQSSEQKTPKDPIFSQPRQHKQTHKMNLVSDKSNEKINSIPRLLPAMIDKWRARRSQRREWEIREENPRIRILCAFLWNRFCTEFDIYSDVEASLIQWQLYLHLREMWSLWTINVLPTGYRVSIWFL